MAVSVDVLFFEFVVHLSTYPTYGSQTHYI